MIANLKDVYESYATNYDALLILFLNLRPLQSQQMLANTTFELVPVEEAELRLENAGKELELLVIVAMYALFEQRIAEQWDRENGLAAATSVCGDTSFQTLLSKRIAQKVRPQDSSEFLKFYLPRAGQKLYSNADEVRKLRNWIAHGRVEKKPNSLTPQESYETLSSFLSCIEPPQGAPAASTVR